MKNPIIKISAIVVCIIAILASFSSAQVILSGSSPLGKILMPKKKAIEESSKQDTRLILKNTGAGIRDVAETSANLGMVAGPADVAIKGAGIDPAAAAKLKAFHVGTSKIVFLVHSTNPISALSADQLKDIFSGKITNWKDVGGPDMPIQILILNSANNGTRMAADAQLLKDVKIAPGASELIRAGEISDLVAKAPGAISFVGVSDVGTGVKIVNDSAATLPLYLLTFGEPEEEEKAVIEAVKAELAK